MYRENEITQERDRELYFFEMRLNPVYKECFHFFFTYFILVGSLNIVL